MTRITPRQVGVLIAVSAWGPGPNSTVAEARKFMDTAIAVAHAESSFVIDGKPSPTQDYGLWQINKPSHPSAFQNGDDRLSDPHYNTIVAKGIWQDAGNSFSPWTGTYAQGKHKKYLGEGARVYDWIKTLDDEQLRAEFNRIPGTRFRSKDIKKLGTINTPGELFDALPNAVADFGNKIITGGKVAGVFVLGLIILILGIVFLLKDTSIGKSASSLLSPSKKASMVSKVLS